MASSYPHPADDDVIVPADAPAYMFVVARRETAIGAPIEYYVGSVVGWTTRLADATMWPSEVWARAVAAIFPRAIVARVMVWHPLLPLANPDDLSRA